MISSAMNPTDTLDADVVIRELRTMITELSSSKLKYEESYPYMSLSYGVIEAMFREFADRIGVGDEINLC
jgi:hypothetical protein